MKYLARKSFVIIEAIFTLICGAAIIVTCLLGQYLGAVPFVLLFCISLAWLIVDSTTTIQINADGIKYNGLRKSIILPYQEIKKCTIGKIHPTRAQDYSIEIIGKHGEKIEVLLDLNFKMIDLILKNIPKDIIKGEQNSYLKVSKKFLDKVKPYLREKEYKKFFE